MKDDPIARLARSPAVVQATPAARKCLLRLLREGERARGGIPAGKCRETRPKPIIGALTMPIERTKTQLTIGCENGMIGIGIGDGADTGVGVAIKPDMAIEIVRAILRHAGEIRHSRFTIAEEPMAAPPEAGGDDHG